jgi:hypothetical protein
VCTIPFEKIKTVRRVLCQIQNPKNLAHKAFYLNQFEIIVHEEKQEEQNQRTRQAKALQRNVSVPIHATLDLTKAMMFDLDKTSSMASPNSYRQIERI